MFKIFNRHTGDVLPFLMNADNEGAGGTGSESTSTSEDGATDLEKAIQTAVSQATEGLSKKNKELLAELKQAKEKVKEAPTGLADADLTELLEIRERLRRDEIANLFATGKGEEGFEKLTKRLRADYEAQLNAEKASKTELQSKAENAERELNNIRIEAAVNAASGSVKNQYQPVIKSLIANRLRLVEGIVRVVDEQGEVEFNKQGKPLTVEELVESLRPQYTDLYHPSVGGGAGGRGSGGMYGANGKLTMEAASNMSFEEYTKARAAGKI